MRNEPLLNPLHELSLMALDIGALFVIVLFLVFGVWSLRTRFQKNEEWPLSVQLGVLLGVFLFYLVQIPVLRIVLQESIVQFIFALLGLLVAGLALYGHIVVSVTSRLLVELLVPDNPNAAASPRLGPAEALEMQQDWEGALHEYYVLARIYPRNPMICVRAANNLIRLNRPADAVAWFERAIVYTNKPEDNLLLVRRLCDALETLDQPEKANEALRLFAQRFAEHETGRNVASQMNEKKVRTDASTGAAPPSDALVALEDAPIDAADE